MVLTWQSRKESKSGNIIFVAVDKRILAEYSSIETQDDMDSLVGDKLWTGLMWTSKEGSHIHPLNWKGFRTKAEAISWCQDRLNKSYVSFGWGGVF